MKKVLFLTVFGFAAAVFADGYEARDDFGGVTGAEGFWTTTAHPERTVHVRTAAIPFSVDPGNSEFAQTFDVFDSRVYTSVFGELLGEFSTKALGGLLLLR